ncbi:MAG: HYR domain-containing protein [Chitinophagales bacterium]
MKRTYILWLLLAAYSLSAQPSTDGLVAYYPFNNNAQDASGNGNDGLLQGNFAAAEDRYGNSCGALYFNGTNAFVTVPNTASLQSPTYGLTLAFWFKATKSATGDIQLPILSKGAPVSQYQFYMQRAFGDSYSEFALSSNFIAEDKGYNGHPLEFDKWYMMVISYDEGWFKAYLNGKLFWQQRKADPFVKNEQPLDICRCALGSSFKYFNGCLDDLRIFNRALSTNEVYLLLADASGKTVQESFSLKMPADIQTVTAKGKCQATVSYDLPQVFLNCGSYELKQLTGPASGSAFNVGNTTVSYQAMSASGKAIEGSFNVSVKDNEPPAFRCPADIMVKAPSDKTTAEVEYLEVTALDNCSNAKVERIEGPASGSSFPLGTTKVAYSAIDEAGNKSLCRFNVTVVEDLTPQLHCINTVVAYASAENNHVKVFYEEPYITLKQNKLSMSRTKGMASGSLFPVGSTEVAYEVSGPDGTNLNCTFTVIVKDTIPPQITKLADIKVNAEPGEKTAIVNYELPKATDAGEDISVKLESGYASGYKFPAGITQVKYSTTDAGGNKSYCAFNVSVIKTDVAGVPKPINLTCPNDIEKPNDKGKQGAVIKYTAPQYNGGQELKLVQTGGLHSGELFPYGVTTCTFMASDITGATKECSFKVKVLDLDPPKMKCPGDTVIMLSHGRRGVQFFYDTPVVTDNNRVDSFMQLQGSKSGCFLPLGVHNYAFKAKDATGNMETCAFKVIVKSEESPDIQEEAPVQLPKKNALGGDSIKYEHNIAVQNCALTVVMYDDGEEDNDIVSVIYNGQILVDHEVIKLLNNGAIRKVIHLGVGAENYLVAKAWNTGTVGLNTLRIDVYEGELTDKKDFKNKKPVYSKVLHSKPGTAGGMILKCSGNQ